MNTEPWQGKDFVQIGDDLPASYISWHDAIAFCRKLTALEQQAGALNANAAYRLPTEAEWEYACRAGTTTRFSFDDSTTLLTDYGWYGGMQSEGNTKQEQHPHRVGQKLGNPWGLFDMHGNVREWCEDMYQNKFSAKRDPALTKEDALRVLRGGAWSDTALQCRAASRDWSSPASAARTFGFRIVREADQ
jgi:formylglycine-generating enzyme required for sulfatase activity